MSAAADFATQKLEPHPVKITLEYGAELKKPFISFFSLMNSLSVLLSESACVKISVSVLYIQAKPPLCQFEYLVEFR